ncbi:beta-ketoacyl-ACP synthase II [Treponema sp.]|uniref:beta-ketoacyl-ACP synthase II n=1 Tax=Treponema sp. TaxID=166 RepID=UPI00298E667F|nr:beta-ketoacyl-ACP synthase II [Treponema sp.]MCQ2241796.1 beta-ketoacyl-ACP synthase II [Treponema sp.]
MEKRRIVITGMGCISPVGNSVDTAWDSIKNGRSGISTISLFDTSDLRVHIAGEVKNFNPEDYGIEKKSTRKMARFTRYAVAAASQAVKDSGYTKESLQDEKCGILLGCCIGGIEAGADGFEKLATVGPDRMPPLTTPLMITNEAAANVSMFFGLHGLSWTMGTACSSGTDAIGLSADLIRAGRCDVCITGGTDAALTRFSVASYDALQALSRNFNECPEKACRPFDRDRDGFVIGEGSAVFVVEELEHAKKRGAHIYAEIAGFGSSCDAYHITSPLKDGSGAALAVKDAIADAGINPEEIGYYNAHGTSTSVNDLAETQMLKTVFGEYAYRMNVSSTKSMTGHLIGAAGAIEAMFCVKALEDNFIPPTINLENQDFEGGCDLNYTANKGIKKELSYAATASLGFGGHNGCLILKKYSEK